MEQLVNFIIRPPRYHLFSFFLSARIHFFKQSSFFSSHSHLGIYLCSVLFIFSIIVIIPVFFFFKSKELLEQDISIFSLVCSFPLHLHKNHRVIFMFLVGEQCGHPVNSVLLEIFEIYCQATVKALLFCNVSIL